MLERHSKGQGWRDLRIEISPVLLLLMSIMQTSGAGSWHQRLSMCRFGAFETKSNHDLSYWDAAMVAAARALGCNEILTEDMGHRREIEGVTIANPFR
jgi:predicted nucleic acid-binding protein